MLAMTKHPGRVHKSECQNWSHLLFCLWNHQRGQRALRVFSQRPNTTAVSLGPFSWGRVSGTTFTFKCVCLHASLGHNYRQRHQSCLRIRNSQRTGHGSSHKHKHTTMPLITYYSNVSHSIPYWEFLLAPFLASGSPESIRVGTKALLQRLHN